MSIVARRSLDQEFSGSRCTSLSLVPSLKGFSGAWFRGLVVLVMSRMTAADIPKMAWRAPFIDSVVRCRAMPCGAGRRGRVLSLAGEYSKVDAVKSRHDRAMCYQRI